MLGGKRGFMQGNNAMHANVLGRRHADVGVGDGMETARTGPDWENMSQAICREVSLWKSGRECSLHSGVHRYAAHACMELKRANMQRCKEGRR
jgi:hypothetical protein